MRFSEQWLRKWVNPDVTTDELSSQLTMAGLEVDSVQPVAGDFTKVVIGSVIEVKPHPDAKRLNCCTVDVNASSPLSIVCGASNVRAGLKVAVAMVGAVLPGDFKIKSTKLRGEPSNGMICSSAELGMGDDSSDGIMELSSDAPTGALLRDYLDLNDMMIDIELTPNRGDCLSIKGLAREVAAINEIALPDASAIEVAIEADDVLSVVSKVPAICPRYYGRIIKSVNNTIETPLWIKEALRRSDLRPINIIVDILNFVMLELGQPMHAFDRDKIQQGIQVRHAQSGETLQLLDGQELTLQSSDVVIADDKQPVALAGIMGGLASSVTEATEHVFLESAFFEPVCIATTARHYKIKSDASYRYERGVDFSLPAIAMERATELIVQYAGGTVCPVSKFEEEPYLPERSDIFLRYERIADILGVEVTQQQVVSFLSSLGLGLQDCDEGWVVSIPSYRFDLSQEIDLIEEVARLYHYDQIPTATHVLPLKIPKASQHDELLFQLKSFLVDHGFIEVISYSFVDEIKALLFSDKSALYGLENPISNDMNVMRTTLWTGLLQAMEYNQRRQVGRQCLFEVGRCFELINGDLQQKIKCGLLMTGSRYPKQWAQQSKPVDFFDLKHYVEQILRCAGLEDQVEWRSIAKEFLHPGQSVGLFLKDRLIGVMGALHPRLWPEWNIDQPAFLFEAELDILLSNRDIKLDALSKFPEVKRDVAVVVDQSIFVAEILQTIEKTEGYNLISVKIFDIYEGVGVPEGKKSVALGLTFQHNSRTLVDEEVNQAMDDILNILDKRYGAILRA